MAASRKAELATRESHAHPSHSRDYEAAQAHELAAQAHREAFRHSGSVHHQRQVAFHSHMASWHTANAEAEDLIAARAIHAADVPTALQIATRLLGGTDTALDKIIEAGLTMLANEADAGAVDEADLSDEEEQDMGWQWVAVLDARTCEQCQFYDGSRWDSDFEPVDDAPEFPDDPPLHYNCRCALIPSDLNAEAAPPKNFDDYLAGFSKSEQEATFGKAALHEYRSGNITAAQLIQQQDHSMSLDEFDESGEEE